MTVMISRMPKVLRRFTRNRRGVAAVEFAIVLPVMIALYLGCAELSVGLSAARKVTLIASTLANVAGQYKTISTTDMTTILNTSTDIAKPFSANNVTVTLSCLKTDLNGKTTVMWSDTLNGTARVVGSMITIPPSLTAPNQSLLLGEASYPYTPAIGYNITGTINLSEKMYMRPRMTAPTYNSTACT